MMRWMQLCVIAILVASLDGGQEQTPSAKPKESRQKQPEPPAAKKVREFLGTRVAFAGMLNAGYRRLGYRIIVEATGPDKRTLELYSGLIFEASRTLSAAREVLTDAGIYANVTHIRFNQVCFKGDEYYTCYAVP
jgi:hypothetical protein